MAYHFGRFVLQEDPLLLWHEGKIRAAKSNILRTLLFLLENRDEVVSKDDLIEHVWKGTIVSDAAIAKRIEQVRKVLGESGKNQHYIKTIYGRGFLFEGDVRQTGEEPHLASPAPEPSAVRAAQPAIPRDEGRPSIAVLPFRLVEVEGPSTQLAEALPDEIITELVKQRAFEVIARGSSFQFESYAVPPAQLATQLGVRYILSGSLEALGETFAASVELADVSTGAVLWSERFSHLADEILALRDALTHRVVVELDSRIARRENIRVMTKSRDNRTAWDHYHRGRSCAFGPRVDRYLEARRHFEAAIADDPDFARAHAGLSQSHFMEYTVTLANRNPSSLEACKAAARDAISLDPEDPYCRLVQARAMAIDMRVGDAMEQLESLTRDCPSHFSAHSDYARLLAFTFQREKARNSAERALQLSPVDPRLFSTFITMMLVELGDENPAAAARWAERSRDLPFRTISAMIMEVLAFRAAGRKEESAIMAEELLAQHPDFDPDTYLPHVPGLAEPYRVMVREAFPPLGK